MGRVVSAVGLRKVVLYCEDVLSENGAAPARPLRRATVAAVIANPWVGTGPTTDLSVGIPQIAPELARVLTSRLLAALGGPDQVQTFGKGALIGSAGELEHGAALLHTAYFGNLVREFLHGESIISFADERADAGQPLVIPMWHKTHAATRTHYQTVGARVPDAPRAEELVIVVGASTGPRPHPRIGDRSTDPSVQAADTENGSS